MKIHRLGIISGGASGLDSDDLVAQRERERDFPIFRTRYCTFLFLRMDRILIEIKGGNKFRK